MTHREINLWGLIAGLALATAFGFYKSAYADGAGVSESEPTEDTNASQPLEELNGSDVGLFGDEPDTNVTDIAAIEDHGEPDSMDAPEVGPVENLLPDAPSNPDSNPEIVDQPSIPVVPQDGGIEQ